jgi:putative transposase
MFRDVPMAWKRRRMGQGKRTELNQAVQFMRRSNFSDDEIRSILREADGGLRPSVVCQSHGISVQTFYRWKTLFGNHSGMIIVRLRNLELENRRLKQTVAELSLDIRTLKLAISKSLH